MIATASPLKSLVSRAAAGLIGCAIATATQAAPPQVFRVGNVAGVNLPAAATQVGNDRIDYVNAEPLRLPTAGSFSSELAQAELIGVMSSPSSQAASRAVKVRGNTGDGKTNPTFVGAPAKYMGSDEYAPQESGTTNHAFSTARADGYTGQTNNVYPYRAAGKIFFKKADGGSYICSGSLIKKGVVVTAAHCVTEYGSRTFYQDFSFVPGYRNGAAPYGKWKAKSIFVVAGYSNGNDKCSARGVICQNDIAVMVLQPQGSRLPGTSTGWYGYTYNGGGFTPNGRIHVTQLGYPGCLDNGGLMERNDSEGFKSAGNTNNTLIGSLMCGGSSGGPWLLNFGRRPELTDTTPGRSPEENMVMGVTSWGSVSNGPKQMGASPFLNTNVQALVDAACNSSPANCN